MLTPSNVTIQTGTSEPSSEPKNLLKSSKQNFSKSIRKVSRVGGDKDLPSLPTFARPKQNVATDVFQRLEAKIINCSDSQKKEDLERVLEWVSLAQISKNYEQMPFDEVFNTLADSSLGKESKIFQVKRLS